VTGMPQRPNLFSLMALLGWLISRKTKRELAAMGRVRPELMRVVYSRLADTDAAARIGGLVRSNPEAAAATLRYVRKTMTSSRSYETDRACRILEAAIKGTPPEPIRAEDLHLFERQRELGWMPLSQAFEQLCAAVPELAEVGARAEMLAASPTEFGIVHDLDENVIVVPAGVLPTTHGLVGPKSSHPDPLIRSSLAATVAIRYVIAVLSHETDRAAWDRARTGLRLTSAPSSGRR